MGRAWEREKKKSGCRDKNPEPGAKQVSVKSMSETHMLPWSEAQTVMHVLCDDAIPEEQPQHTTA